MTTLEAPAAAITDADLARPLRVFQNRPTLGVPFWRWECRACGDSGGGGSHPDAVDRALTHCVEHPSHPSSLVPPVNCRQDNPRAPLRTIYEWLVARNALETLDGDPDGLAPSDREFAALAALDGTEFADLGPLDGDYAVFASVDDAGSADSEIAGFASAEGEFAGFGPLDGDLAALAEHDADPAGLRFLDRGFDGESVHRRLQDGWSRALPVTWPPNELFETSGTWAEPLEHGERAGQAASGAVTGPSANPDSDSDSPEGLGAWPPLPSDSPLRPTGGATLGGDDEREWGAVIGGSAPAGGGEQDWGSVIDRSLFADGDDVAAVDREPVIGPMLPSRRYLPLIAGQESSCAHGPAEEGSQPAGADDPADERSRLITDPVEAFGLVRGAGFGPASPEPGADHGWSSPSADPDHRPAPHAHEDHDRSDSSSPDAPVVQDELPGLTAYAH
ncbi:hypothetical protein [Catenuloplanes japonicus]|uniref:hypothetical protein n=1 Tax=Catenuloplanes japonicus TaxID=33876 RepID=UPI00068F1DD8|nr:hypothetical protein [Catenuloplanes japonicus]